MPPTVVNAKAGEEVTIEVAFSATNMDVGKYELICACIGGFLPTDMTFDVVAATDAPAIIVIDPLCKTTLNGMTCKVVSLLPSHPNQAFISIVARKY